MKIYAINFILFLGITSCVSSNKKDNSIVQQCPIIENYGDFPVTDTYFYLYFDIKEQLNCDCLEFEFDESLSDEQGNLIFLGASASSLLNSKDSFNIVDLRYDFLNPPDFWFLQKRDNECTKVHVPKITMSKGRTLFFGNFQIPSVNKNYLLLMIREKNFVWKKKITGALI